MFDSVIFFQAAAQLPTETTEDRIAFISWVIRIFKLLFLLYSATIRTPRQFYVLLLLQLFQENWTILVSPVQRKISVSSWQCAGCVLSLWMLSITFRFIFKMNFCCATKESDDRKTIAFLVCLPNKTRNNREICVCLLPNHSSESWAAQVLTSYFFLDYCVHFERSARLKWKWRLCLRQGEGLGCCGFKHTASPTCSHCYESENIIALDYSLECH